MLLELTDPNMIAAFSQSQDMLHTFVFFTDLLLRDDETLMFLDPANFEQDTSNIKNENNQMLLFIGEKANGFHDTAHEQKLSSFRSSKLLHVQHVMIVHSLFVNKPPQNTTPAQNIKDEIKHPAQIKDGKADAIFMYVLVLGVVIPYSGNINHVHSQMLEHKRISTFALMAH